MTQRSTTPRPRTPSLAQQAGSIAARRPQQGLALTRRALLDLAQRARESGDHLAYRQVVQVMVDVRAAAARELATRAAASLRVKRQPTGDDDITAWLALELGVYDLVPRSPNQIRREVEQRAAAGREQALIALRQRDTERYAANVLATALWALHQGHRDWTPLPSGASSSTRPPSDAPGSRPLGAAYLEVEVPDSRFSEAHRLRLFRADYEALLDLWGYHRVTRATRLAERLRGLGESGGDVQALHSMALESARHPNLAQAWHGYVTGGRLGDVFREHAPSGTMQLAGQRSGDLREAAMEVYRQCQVLIT